MQGNGRGTPPVCRDEHGNVSGQGVQGEPWLSEPYTLPAVGSVGRDGGRRALLRGGFGVGTGAVCLFEPNVTHGQLFLCTDASRRCPFHHGDSTFSQLAACSGGRLVLRVALWVLRGFRRFLGVGL